MAGAPPEPPANAPAVGSSQLFNGVNKMGMSERVTSLVCPTCGGDLISTVDSRQDIRQAAQLNVKAIRRRKLCEKCGKRATTIELVLQDLDTAISANAKRYLENPEVTALIGRLIVSGAIK